MDNLWDGLGALVVENPDIKYFFGKVTMYTHFNPSARNLLLYFLSKYFNDPENLVEPIHPLNTGINEDEMVQLINAGNYLEDYKTLSREIRKHGENIPPLINAYMGLSPTMKVFGTVINNEFGAVEETGILITINDMYYSKIERHVSTYDRVKYYLKKEKDKLF